MCVSACVVSDLGEHPHDEWLPVEHQPSVAPPLRHLQHATGKDGPIPGLGLGFGFGLGSGLGLRLGEGLGLG